MALRCSATSRPTDLDRTIAILKDDPVNARWSKSMAPIMKIEIDERRGFPFLLPLQWHMD